MEDGVTQSAGLNKKDETHDPVGRPSLRSNRFRGLQETAHERQGKRRGNLEAGPGLGGNVET